MNGEYYYNNLQCGCLLDYTLFSAWLDDLELPDAVRKDLQARVLQTGGLEYSDWVLLLNSVGYITDKGAAYYLTQYNTCGFMCLSELVQDVRYRYVRYKIFTRSFTTQFN